MVKVFQAFEDVGFDPPSLTFTDSIQSSGLQCAAVPFRIFRRHSYVGFFPCAFEMKKCSLCGFALSVFVACQVKDVCRISSARP